MTTNSFLPIGAVTRIHRRPDGIECECEHGRVRIHVLADDIVRVRATQATGFGPDFSYAIDPQFRARTPRAGANPWPKVQVTGGSIALSTGTLTVRVARQPLRIRFERADGTLLNGDEPARGMGWEGPKCRSYRTLAADEMFLACGEKTSPLNKRGHAFANWNSDVPGHTYMTDAIYASIPFLISARPPATPGAAPVAYGVFFDNSHRTFFNLGQVEDEQHYFLEADAGELDYYFLAGETVAEVARAYARLTGRMHLPPRWALGYQQCRWSYNSADEVLQVAKEFRQRQIPADVMYCDIDYMDGYRVWTWNPKTFPKPGDLIAKLRKLGFRLVTIVDPGVKNDDQYAVCQEGKEQGMFVRKPDGSVYVGEVWPGPSVFPDFTSPRVRAWWGDWQKRFLDLGVAGFWNDMNDPSVFGVKTMPLDNLHEYEGEWASHARAHNVYGLAMARACFEGCRRHRPDERPFVITRSAYAGVQRYSMMWLGDNNSRWEQLALSIPQSLNMSLSGVTFCGVDIGGFGDHCTAELLARWMQAGALMPFCRNHSAIGTRRQEPWSFGPEVEAICRQYIRLRYQFLPYLYTVFATSARDGTPIMRPLFWEFPGDRRAYTVDDQYLCGASLLVAPVLKQAARERTVYLPAGSDWYDYWTKEKLAGGRDVTASAPLDRLPLYVRAGSILPTMEPVEHTGEVEGRPISLDVYPGPATSGELYEDDGASFAYEQGKYRLTTFTWQGGVLKAKRRHDGYPAASDHRVLVLGRQS